MYKGLEATLRPEKITACAVRPMVRACLLECVLVSRDVEQDGNFGQRSSNHQKRLSRTFQQSLRIHVDFQSIDDMTCVREGLPWT